MNFCFHGYTVRATTEADLALALAWTLPALDARFWLKQDEGRQSFLVIEAGEARCKCGHLNIPDHYLTSQDEEGELWCLKCSCREYREEQGNLPIAFFQTQTVGTHRDQVRLAFQASPVASRKKILRGITRLVPLIEKALALRGVRAIFFTSHSPQMAYLMHRRHGYRYESFDTADGLIMAKRGTD
jgi:hypothetical protein